ncbi:MAG TPA: hypothetical protein VHK01_10480 [Lacipirellulaceae bacterium]|jgi:hypothetical protein|nr:hypothetical protein [Lacipirellulaceae bacterium]
MRSFAELSAREKSIEVVRWVLVVPAAWLAGMVPVFLERLIRPPMMVQPPGTPRPPVSDFQRIYLPHLLGVVMAAAFVIVGAKVAPRWRLPVAGILAAAWIVYSYLLHVMPHGSFELKYLTQFIVATLGAIAATMYVWWAERDRRAGIKAAHEEG